MPGMESSRALTVTVVQNWMLQRVLSVYRNTTIVWMSLVWSWRDILASIQAKPRQISIDTFHYQILISFSQHIFDYITFQPSPIPLGRTHAYQPCNLQITLVMNITLCIQAIYPTSKPSTPHPRDLTECFFYAVHAIYAKIHNPVDSDASGEVNLLRHRTYRHTTWLFFLTAMKREFQYNVVVSQILSASR